MIDVYRIIEEIAEVVYLKKDEGNLHLSLKSRIANELKVDQSIAHNGVCLTVIDIHIDSSTYTVTAVRETLQKSSLGLLDLGSKVNLERSLRMGGRIDGHMVQGHVDQTAKCINRVKDQGYMFTLLSIKNQIILS